MRRWPGELLQFRDRGFGGDAQRVLVDRPGRDLLQQGIGDGQFAQAGTEPAQRFGLDVVFSPHSPVAFQTLDDLNAMPAWSVAMWMRGSAAAVMVLNHNHIQANRRG
jgi:hypothetical protein